MRGHWTEAEATVWHQLVLPVTLRDAEETVPGWRGLEGSSEARDMSPVLRAVWTNSLTAHGASEDGPRCQQGATPFWGKGLGR